MINQKKLAGILTELSAEMDRTKFVVLGMGININTSLESLPSGATSLKLEGGKNYSRIEILQNILKELEEYYLRFRKQGFTSVAQQWRELSVTLGKRVRITDSCGQVEGEAVNIDEDGGLLIRKDSGIVVKKMSGDVVQVR